MEDLLKVCERGLIITIVSLIGFFADILRIPLPIIIPQLDRWLSGVGKDYQRWYEDSIETGSIANVVNDVGGEYAEATLGLMDNARFGDSVESLIVSIPFIVVALVLYATCKKFWMISVPVLILIGIYIFSPSLLQTVQLHTSEIGLLYNRGLYAELANKVGPYVLTLLILGALPFLWRRFFR